MKKFICIAIMASFMFTSTAIADPERGKVEEGLAIAFTMGYIFSTRVNTAGMGNEMAPRINDICDEYGRDAVKEVYGEISLNALGTKWLDYPVR